MKMKKLTAAEIATLGKLSLDVNARDVNDNHKIVSLSVDTETGNLWISDQDKGSIIIELKDAPQVTAFMNDLYPMTKEPKEKKARKKRTTKAEKLSNQVKYEAPEGESLAM